MPFQIDRLETTIEMSPPERGQTGAAASTPPSPPPNADVLRERVSQIMRDELELFLRQRGM